MAGCKQNSGLIEYKSPLKRGFFYAKIITCMLVANMENMKEGYLMKVKVCIDKFTYIWNQHIPFNAWYGEDNLGFFFCTAHKKSPDLSLTLYRYDGVRWVKSAEISDTTRKISAWADRHNLWYTKCQWFNDDDRKLKEYTKCISHHDSIASMMKHSRRHKKSGMGTRLDKENFFADKTFTDYECRHEPIHDFRRYNF